MHIGLISLILLFGLLLLLALGMPLGFASGFMAVAVLLMKFGPEALFGNFGSGVLNILFKRMYDLTSTYALVAVPLFILMAAFLERSGIARDMYDCLGRWLNRTRGGVAVATSLMAVVMAAMSGIVGGEVVLLGLLALPQMLRLGYDKNLAVGVICASGTLGTMIPPSVVLIMYGLITETSITALFTGAFAPGFLLASFYVVYILIRTRMQPHLAPLPPPSPDDLSPKQKLSYGGALASMALILWFAVSLARLLSPDKGGESPPPDAWHFPALMIALAAGWLFFSAGKKTIREAWQAGRGLMAPGIVVFVVLGSIYGGITTITEAAGMGVMAVLILVLLRGEFSLRFMRESLVANIQIHRRDYVGDFRRDGAGGGLHHCGRSVVCGKFNHGGGVARAGGADCDDAFAAGAGRVYGLGGDCAFDDAGVFADCAKFSGGVHWPVWRAVVRRRCARLVWRFVLHEYAGVVFVAAVWSGGVLFKVGCAAVHFPAGHFSRLRPVHRPANHRPLPPPPLPRTDNGLPLLMVSG